MTRITLWEPLHEARQMQRMLDRYMDRSFLEAPSFSSLLEGGVPIDVYQTDKEVVVKINAPGFKAEDIDISVTGDHLNIRGEIQAETEEEGVQYHIRERHMESFARSLVLPNPVESDKAKAEFTDGILTLTLPKIEEVKPKKITIKAK